MDAVTICSLSTVQRMSSSALARLLRSREDRALLPAGDPFVQSLLPVVRDDSRRPPRVRQFASDYLIFRDLPAWKALINELEDTRQYGRVSVPNAPGSVILPAPLMAVVLYIPHLRAPFNGGNIIRTAAAYGITGVVFGRHTPDITHPRMVRAAMGGDQYVLVGHGDLETAKAVLPERWGKGLPVRLAALETPGQALPNLPGVAPDTGLVLIAGSEEHGVPEDLLRAAEQQDGVFEIPHQGPKESLNVGVAVGIALHHLWSVSPHSASTLTD